MPDNITQQLGFDASKAIQELARLRTSLNDFKQSLQSVSGALRKFPSSTAGAIKGMQQLKAASQQTNTTLAQTGKTAGAAGTQVQAAGAKIQQSATGAAVALDKVGAAGAQSARTINLSWKTVARVVQAQLIVRGLAAITGAFFDARQSAQEFSIAVAEALTISGGELGNLQQVSASVLELSRNLGLAPTEVAEGLYQTLSNQVVSAGDALRFEEEAAKLAIATHTELKTAVNALSSVMNSYNLNVAETAHVSDVLFKTVELGRLRLDEFGDIVGRVLPLTETLGIRYEEAAAAIAALTQKGIPASTAITQLTQVSQKLLRPTEKLNALYAEWGVETGPEAIRRFGGLRQVLLKMKDATAGNDKEFADLLGRVRALVGSLNLTSDSANALDAALKEMDDSAGATEKALGEIEDAAGRQAVRAFNELKATVTDLGATLLEATTPLIRGFDVLLQNFEFLQAAAVGVVAGLAGMKLASLSAAGSFATLTGTVVALKAAFLTFLPVLAAVAVALAAVAVTKAIKASLDTVTAANEETKRLQEELSRTHEDESKKRIATTKKEFEARRKITGEFYSQASKLYAKDLQLLQASAKATAQTLQAAVGDAFKGQQAEIEKIRKASLDSDSAIKSSQESVRKTQVAAAEDAFKRGNRFLTERQQLWREIERGQQTASKARKAFAKAGASEEAARAARELSQTAEQRAQEAVTHAESLGNAADVRRAENALDKIRNTRIKAELKFQADRKKFQSQASKERLSQLEQEGRKAQELIKLAQELLNTFEKGQKKGSAQIKADFERVLELTPQIEQALDAAFDFDFFQKLGVTDATNRLKTELIDALGTAKIDWDAQAAAFQESLSKAKFTANIELAISNPKILEAFQTQFGELDLAGDPGKIGDRMAQVLEGIIEKAGELDEKIDQTGDIIEDRLTNVQSRLAPEQFFNKWERGFDTIRRGVAVLENVDTARAQGDAEALAEAYEVQATPAQELQQRLQQIADTVRKAADEERALTDAEKAAARAAFDFGQEADKAGKLSTNSAQGAIAAFNLLFEAIARADERAAAIQERAELGTAPEVAEETSQSRVEEATRLLEATKKVTEEEQKGKAALDQQATSAKNVEAGMRQARQAASGMQPALAAGTQELANSSNVVGTLNNALDSSKAAIDASTQAASGWNTQLGNCATSGGAAADSMLAAASAAEKAGQACAQASGACSGGPVTAAHGGRYLAMGGAARGTDTIPAMLSPGEFVINAASARRFFPQLQAMNAGVKPIYREEGGPVTNVGDVNITVNEASSGKDSARNVMTAFNREMRRRTGKI